MSVVLYNIEHPTVDNDSAQNRRSHDTQVNGLGFYRTASNGTTGLLVQRANAVQHLWSVASPSDVAATALVGIFSSIGNTLIRQFVLPAYDYHFSYDLENNAFAFTTFVDKGSILGADPAILGGIGYMVARVISASDGTFGTYDWELDTTVDRTMNLARSTYVWEGMNSWFVSGASWATYTGTTRFDGVGFAFWDLINNGTWIRYSTNFAQTVLEHQELTKGRIPSQTDWTNWLSSGVEPTEESVDVFITQRWESLNSPAENDPLGATSPDISDLYGFIGDITGNINSEDASGRRGTYQWELDMFDIQQTSYWAFHDTLADEALGAAIELDNDVPVGNNIAAVFQEHMFLAGDPDNPHYLYWSKRFKPESWPLENFVEIGTAADPIRSIQPQTGVLGVFTSNTKYRIQGNATAGFIHDEAVSHRGAPAPKSVVSTDKGVFFVARDGVFVTNFLSADEKISDAIDPLFLGITKNGYSPINLDALNEVAGGFYKNKYYFSFPSGSSLQNDTTAIFSVDSKTWTFWNVGYASFYAEDDTNLFLAGGYDSLVYIIENPEAFDDNGTAISFELQTGDFTGSAQTTRNLFLYFKVDAEAGDGEVSCQFYVDDTLVRTETITGSRTNELIRLPENSFGHRWRMRITYTGNRRIAVNGVTAIFLPLLAAA